MPSPKPQLKNQILPSTKKAVEIPSVFTAFNNPLPLLLSRSKQWHAVLVNLHSFLTHHHNLTISLSEQYHLRTTEEICLEPRIINSMDCVAATGVRKAIEKVTHSILPLGKKFGFDYSEFGGVNKNLELLRKQSEALFVCEDERREKLVGWIEMVKKMIESVLEKGIKPLESWMKRLDEAKQVKVQAIETLKKFAEIRERLKEMKDDDDENISVPGEMDPLLYWLQYTSLRSHYIDHLNILKQTCQQNQKEAPKHESTLIKNIESLLQEYITHTKQYHLTRKTLFPTNNHPISTSTELTHFLTLNPSIPTPPLRPHPPKLLFTNFNHIQTQPLLQINLHLDAFLNFLTSRGGYKPYILTRGGFLMKVPKTDDPVPGRAFRLLDCVVLERVPRAGIGCFVLRGWNVGRRWGEWGSLMDWRTRWRFSGREGEVGRLMEGMRLFLPSVGYEGWWSTLGYV